MADYDQLLTVGEVSQSSLASSVPVEQEKPTVVASIRDVQAEVESYLRQPLMPHRRVQGIERRDWARDRLEQSVRYRAWAEARPVVEVVSPDSVTPRYDSEQLISDQRRSLKAEYFAGYVREGQSLTGLPTGSGDPLEGLTEEPPTLPRDIRKVAIRLVLFDLNVLEHSPGMRETSVTGPESMTVSGPDKGFKDRQLKRLSTYRRSVHY